MWAFTAATAAIHSASPGVTISASRSAVASAALRSVRMMLMYDESSVLADWVRPKSVRAGWRPGDFVPGGLRARLAELET